MALVDLSEKHNKNTSQDLGIQLTENKNLQLSGILCCHKPTHLYQSCLAIFRDIFVICYLGPNSVFPPASFH